MRNKFKILLASLVAAIGISGLAIGAYTQPLGGSIWPLTFVTQPVVNLADSYNQMLALVNAQATPSANPVVSGTFSGYGMTLGATGGATSPFQNPLIQGSLYDVTVASLNAPKGGTNANDLIIANSGRKIYPIGAGIQVYASGTPATCTGIKLACDGTTNGALFVSQPGGNIIATFPVAATVDKVAVTPFMVASAVSYGSAMTLGCPIGEGVIASTYGSGCTTNTDMFIQFPYLVQ